MILIFDLDDTLYEEITFVKSGFNAVSKFLKVQFNIPSKESYELMLKAFNTDGRGETFNKVLKHYNIYLKKNVLKCLSIYRLHTPNIKLYNSVIKCLDRFHSSPKYIVTDGNKIVQKNKIIALNLTRKVKKVFITHQYGLKNAKPSLYCFQKISTVERTPAENIVYIGDNPNKDFIGIKPLGFKTIRVLTGNHRFEKLDNMHEAHLSINSLDEIDNQLLRKLGTT